MPALVLLLGAYFIHQFRRRNQVQAQQTPRRRRRARPNTAPTSSSGWSSSARASAMHWTSSRSASRSGSTCRRWRPTGSGCWCGKHAVGSVVGLRAREREPWSDLAEQLMVSGPDTTSGQLADRAIGFPLIAGGKPMGVLGPP